MIKADLHTHTLRSADGRQSLEQLIAAAKACGLNAVAVTDHNLYSEVPKRADLLLIPGCEFSTDIGHITGLFLDEAPETNKKYTAREAVEEIHRRGGIAIWAHPYQKGDRPMPSGIDGIETANARADYKQRGANAKAIALAKEAGLPEIGGSDAHSVKEVGNAYTEIDCEECTLAALKAAILKGDCRAVLVRNTPRRRIGLSQLTRRRRMGGLKNLCIGFLYLIKSFLIDIKER